MPLLRPLADLRTCSRDAAGEGRAIVALVVEAAGATLTALTEFTLSLLVFLTVAGIVATAPRSAGIRCTLAPILCGCASAAMSFCGPEVPRVRPG
jgi:hypothetical protein